MRATRSACRRHVSSSIRPRFMESVKPPLLVSSLSMGGGFIQQISGGEAHSEEAEETEDLFKAHLPGVGTPRPRQALLSDFLSFFRMGQEVLNLCYQVFKPAVRYDFIGGIDLLQFRMVFGHVEPAAHGNLEVPPLQAVGAAMP